MRIPRVYFPPPLSEGSRVSLDERARRYLIRVLRLRAGAELWLFDGRGREYRAVLETVARREARARILERLGRDAESALRIVLGQGISRGERMDYALQKAVELGVNRMVPVFTGRSGVKFSGARVEKRQRHWQGIAISACEQCGRNYVPPVESPRSLGNFLEGCRLETKILLDSGGEQPLKALPSPLEGELALLIGPEGGLTQAEIEQARQAGFAGARLGPRILRTETATVAALTAVQLCWGDL